MDANVHESFPSRTSATEDPAAYLHPRTRITNLPLVFIRVYSWFVSVLFAYFAVNPLSCAVLQRLRMSAKLGPDEQTFLRDYSDRLRQWPAPFGPCLRKGRRRYHRPRSPQPGRGSLFFDWTGRTWPKSPTSSDQRRKDAAGLLRCVGGKLGGLRKKTGADQ